MSSTSCSISPLIPEKVGRLSLCDICAKGVWSAAHTSYNRSSRSHPGPTLCTAQVVPPGEAAKAAAAAAALPDGLEPFPVFGDDRPSESPHSPMGPTEPWDGGSISNHGVSGVGRAVGCGQVRVYWGLGLGIRC